MSRYQTRSKGKAEDFSLEEHKRKAPSSTNSSSKKAKTSHTKKEVNSQILVSFF